MSINLKAAQLKACEETIERGQQTFIEVGQALARIRDERLYREDGYTSFDDYCQARWSMKKSYASQLISASAVGQEFAIANEGQAREIRRVPEDKRLSVLERATQVAEEREQTITAAVIREVATENEPNLRCCHCEIHCPVRYTKPGGLDA